MKLSYCFTLAIMACLLHSCGLDPFHTGFDDMEDAVRYEALKKSSAPTSIDTLTVMTWNIKFAGGRIDFFYDCYGNRTLMKENEVVANLEGLASKINQVDPDILLLQEADTESKRCAYINNIQWLLDHTDFNYGVYASQWKADYVPSDGIGRVNSGNAVLSRWPFEEAVRIALPLISEHDALKKYFYLRRNILEASVLLPGGTKLWVVNIHTAAFAHDGTKQKQINQLKDELDGLHANGDIFVCSGDLNTLPPGAAKVKEFPDSKCEAEEYQADDYSAEGDCLRPFYQDYSAAIDSGTYQANESRYFSHTTDKDGFWNRKLDYLFTNGAFVSNTGMVHQDQTTGGVETMLLSDHAPVTVRMMVP